MKELKRIVAIYQQIDPSRRKVALATVVYVEGSAYRRPGAHMLVTDDGRWEGAISGGCLEGDALRKARQVMLDGKPMVVRYDTMDDEANGLGIGLGCNGIIDVFIEPIDPADPKNPIAWLHGFVQQRDPRVIATVFGAAQHAELAAGTRFVLGEPFTDSVPHGLYQDMEFVRQSGQSLTQAYSLGNERIGIFIERIDPGIELIIFGAGYDTIPLTRLATEIGWAVTITEDCIAHLAPKRFPAATCVLYADAEAVMDKITINDRTAAVLMSHNYNYDRAVLAKLLETHVPYIGILGPRKRYEKMQAQWHKAGKQLSQISLDRVHSPIGLDLGAETPDEIALAILGEIKAFFSQRSGGFLTNQPGPIHQRNKVQSERIYS